jgi:hypothetical protein
MPAEKVAMRHAREIIRLKFLACVPTREIDNASKARSSDAGWGHWDWCRA